MYLEVAKLSEVLSTIIELASERLDSLVNNLVCPNVATLRKSLSADLTAVWAFSGVPSLVCLWMLTMDLIERATILTLRLPSWENFCPHPEALHS